MWPVRLLIGEKKFWAEKRRILGSCLRNYRILCLSLTKMGMGKRPSVHIIAVQHNTKAECTERMMSSFIHNYVHQKATTNHFT